MGKMEKMGNMERMEKMGRMAQMEGMEGMEELGGFVEGMVETGAMRLIRVIRTRSRQIQRLVRIFSA